MISYISQLSALHRRGKVAIQVCVDAALIILCFLAAFLIRLESLSFLRNLEIWLPLAISSAFTIFALWRGGLYRTLVRFVTGKVLQEVAIGVLIFAISLYVTNNILSAGIPRSVPIISGILLFLAVTGLRFAVRYSFRLSTQTPKKPVVIYGAGNSGLELLNSLTHGRDYAPIAFVDDDNQFHGLTIGGLRVYPPKRIESLAREFGVEVVLLAMPNLPHARRREIFADLAETKLEIKTIPNVSDIISGKAKLSEIRNVSTEDLLGRDAIAPNQELLSRNTTGKVVMVTGAGGSIGSELCRQILNQKPKVLVLFEISEFGLYAIEKELELARALSDFDSKVIPVIGSVQNERRLISVIEKYRVETIYHAAAYKHVPLVEENIVEATQNNIFGTYNVANAALDRSVENFILISTDKAVRPANVMGATKRVAELICQAMAKDATRTTFSMVRFGNVLGSSGSVIPRFRKQIERGGPVTVTHREITRYFMTIPEAAQLVIQAGAMARGGDVFVLDMGEAVKIADLAVTMVKLHGLNPYFAESGDRVIGKAGDIPICFTGLRKGEKLFEELLISGKPQPTEHPRIMTAEEISIKSSDLSKCLAELNTACGNDNAEKIQDILLNLPIEYRRDDNIDILF
ncbi:nucleoside-diphosphate sugar epimerase [Qipengyuania flava]|uniref:polysaccharide biosynthesis protein n=1 Tax=Qipengyuania flava TaxID=192812 RepID=UPI000B8C580E|nr:nucleoside-diphosphate sugar epimerase/dehydratase [Qipengyuania flava]ASP29966.1 nucleoside-diphosphate sugar epimerase [Qipengyuania flava]